MSDFVDAPVPYAVLTGAATGQVMPQCARLTVLSLLPCLAPIILLLIWQISAELGWIATTVFLALSDVVAATYRLTLSGEPGAHIWVSAPHAFAGFCMGGPLNGVSRLSERLTGTMIQMVRNIPNLAPLVILWFDALLGKLAYSAVRLLERVASPGMPLFKNRGESKRLPALPSRACLILRGSD
jgi:hypothetical protein